MASYGIPENPALMTTSRLRMWWLHSVRGYKVLNKRRQPHTGVFGPSYEDIYLLVPRRPSQH